MALGGRADAVVLDTSVEDFDSRTADATINGVEFWSVSAGAAASAVVQSGVTAAGTGRALELVGASTPVTVQRTTTYGGLTPTWVRCLIRPGVGGERRAAPTAGIAAVSFDMSGKVLAADGTSWVDTGATYSPASWYEVRYKLSFTTHTYDLYVSLLAASGTASAPVKTLLHFIDSSKNSLSRLQFQGAYSTTQSDDTYVDDLMVTYVDRLAFVSAAQTLLQDQPSGPITVQLQDSVQEPQRAAADVVLELKSTSSGGTFSLQREPWQAVTQIVVPKDAASVSFYYQDSRVGKPTLSAKEFPDQGWTEGLQQQNVISRLSHFEVLVTSPQTAGTPFPVTVYARTDSGAVDEAYTGTVSVFAAYVDPTTGTAPIVPAEASGFTQGKLELTATYADAGAILITVVDPSNPDKPGASGQILMLPAAFRVEAGPRQVVGKPFPLVVTALNAAGAVTPNYHGTATLTVQGVAPTTGSGVLTPAALGGADFHEGRAAVDVAYPRWGTIRITATDAASARVTGQSEPLMCHPETLQLRVLMPPAPRDFFYTEELFTVEVSLLGAGGVVIPNYGGTVTFQPSSGMTLPDHYVFTADDQGTRRFPTSISAPGLYHVSATDAAAVLTSPSASLTVKQALLKVLPAVGPAGGAAEVTILLVDDHGQVIQSENAATFTLKAIEDTPNQSVSSSAFGQPVTLTRGRATIVVADTEAETVTLVPSALVGMKVQRGTVSFGRFAAKGVGILSWREVVDTPSR